MRDEFVVAYLKCFGIEAQPQSVPVVPGAQRVTHDLYVFEVREVRVLLREEFGVESIFELEKSHAALSDLQLPAQTASQLQTDCQTPAYRD